MKKGSIEKQLHYKNQSKFSSVHPYLPVSVPSSYEHATTPIPPTSNISDNDTPHRSESKSLTLSSSTVLLPHNLFSDIEDQVITGDREHSNPDVTANVNVKTLIESTGDHHGLQGTACDPSIPSLEENSLLKSIEYRASQIEKDVSKDQESCYFSGNYYFYHHISSFCGRILPPC